MIRKAALLPPLARHVAHVRTLFCAQTAIPAGRRNDATPASNFCTNPPLCAQEIFAERLEQLPKFDSIPATQIFRDLPMQNSDIQESLRFNRIDDAARRGIAEVWPVIEPELPRFLKDFYAHVAQRPDLKNLFSRDRRAHV